MADVGSGIESETPRPFVKLVKVRQELALLIDSKTPQNPLSWKEVKKLIGESFPQVRVNEERKKELGFDPFVKLINYLTAQKVPKRAELDKPPLPDLTDAQARALLDAKARYEYSLEQNKIRDPATGLLNRRGFTEFLKDRIKRYHKKYNGNVALQQFSVLMADINFLKDCNDDYGHPFGDLVIQKVAQAFQTIFNNTDEPDAIVSRIGGDEFYLFLPGSIAITDPRLTRLIDFIRTTINQESSLRSQVDSKFKGDLSLGIVNDLCLSDIPDDSEGILAKNNEWYAMADKALYQAKKVSHDENRTSVAIWDESMGFELGKGFLSG